MNTAAKRPVEISVIIPTYNEASRVKPSLEIVLDYLRASRHTWELIVVDDGSQDATIEIVLDAIDNEPRARLIYLSRWDCCALYRFSMKAACEITCSSELLSG